MPLLIPCSAPERPNRRARCCIRALFGVPSLPRPDGGGFFQRPFCQRVNGCCCAMAACDRPWGIHATPFGPGKVPVCTPETSLGLIPRLQIGMVAWGFGKPLFPSPRPSTIGPPSVIHSEVVAILGPTPSGQIREGLVKSRATPYSPP
jgi:hypothetical protein